MRWLVNTEVQFWSGQNPAAHGAPTFDGRHRACVQVTNCGVGLRRCSTALRRCVFKPCGCASSLSDGLDCWFGWVGFSRAVLSALHLRNTATVLIRCPASQTPNYAFCPISFQKPNVCVHFVHIYQLMNTNGHSTCYPERIGKLADAQLVKNFPDF
jgi:hypothetical protein